MRRRATLLFAALALTVALPGSALAAEQRFTATLDPDSEIPEVTEPSDGSGEAHVTVSDDRATVTYEVSYQDLTGDVQAAHIHFGGPDVAGPVMLPLAHGASPFSGSLTEADFSPVDDGPQTFDEAVDAILEGNSYVNLHTEANPGGEIRGQLEELPPTDAVPAAGSDGSTLPLNLALFALVAIGALALGARRFAFGGVNRRR